jgi:murein DD-endopeptidase MepM/ murein hydrolase activator NlpD
LCACLALALCLMASASCLLTPTALASPALTKARQDLSAAKAQLAKIQEELDRYSAAYDNAQTRMAEIENALAEVEREEQRTRADMAAMEAQLAERVVNYYKGRNSGTLTMLEVLLEGSDLTAALERLDLVRKVASADQDVFTQVERHLEKVGRLEADLVAKQAEQESRLAELKSSQANLENRLKAMSAEYTRLNKKVADLAEAERKAAEAARARAARQVTGSAGSTQAAKGFVFPVNGPHSYTNTWLAARSGGRRHKGTDIYAARGTALVACVSGTILRASWNSGLGGTSIWIAGNNGTHYYYAHMDSIAGGIRAGVSVKAGQYVGTVGDSGNARGGTCHLHFEVHPGGGAAVNPYYILKAAQ